jgi:DNA processing protein
VSATAQERLALLALARVNEPGSWEVHEALQRASAVEVWEGLRAGEPLGQLGQRALEGIAVRVDGYQPERDMQRLHDLGGRLLCPGDDEWPEGLSWRSETMTAEVKAMAPPWALLVRGPHQLAPACVTSVAIVGARAATPYGTHMAAELGFALAEAGVTVVSGGAYGIDVAAHKGALSAAGAPTVAVLACGLDVAYPRAHDRVLAEIAEKGLVISEVPPGSAPTRVRFLVRNRIVAALTLGTVVVEAAKRSGSLSTAGRALDLNRQVMAVPGHVTAAQTGGCHELIRSGKATLVRDAADVLDVVSPVGMHTAAPRRGEVRPRDGLDEQVLRVLDAVPVKSAVGVARIAKTAGVSALVVQMVLPELLIAGLVEQRDGAWRLTGLGASS